MGMFRRRGGDGGGGAGGGGSNSSIQKGDGDVDGTGHGSTSSMDPELQGQVQEVMKDNLEMMKDIVMRIREDPEFAKGIYKNCPRLQHLLQQYPDLRPIFEDPKLVRLNFEQVYRDAGGVLPEDEKKKSKSWLVWFVHSPIFKVLKLALFVKKLVMCITGGGFAFLTGCIAGCCCEDALDVDDNDADFDDPGIDPSKEALNRAADHMEDPEVQEQMQKLLDDPDNLQDAIANDPELSALRDSNPLCEQLMSDPDTMRVLTDPDNLRALGEAPSLIEADFASPDSFVPDPDIETGGIDNGGLSGYDAFDGTTGEDGVTDGVDLDVDLDADVDGDQGDDGFDLNLDADPDADADPDGDGVDEAGAGGDGGGGGNDDGGWWEDAEIQDTDGGPDAGTGDASNQGGAHGGAMARSQARAEEDATEAAEGGGGGGRFGGIMASIGVMATDLIAAQIVGSVFGGDLLPIGDFGGGGDLDVAGVDQVATAGDGLDAAGDGLGAAGDGLDAAGDGLDSAGDGLDTVTNLADNAGDMVNEDVANAVQDTVEEIEGKAEERGAEGMEAAEQYMTEDDGKNAVAIGAGVAAGVAIGGAAGVMAYRAHKSRGRNSKGLQGEDVEEQVEEEQFEDETDKNDSQTENNEAPKKSRFGFSAIAKFGSALATAAKEQVASTILGDDFGEAVAEGRKKGGERDDRKLGDSWGERSGRSR